MAILLNPDLEHRIAAKVQSGHYQSPAEVIQEGLDLLDARDSATQVPAAQSEESLSEIFVRLGQQVPMEEWSKIPTDFSKNLDHYLYGAPKASE
ncbi:MAG: type II toxin-antitoxin system ParD family antitoxin [Terracidiphilus sp.]